MKTRGLILLATLTLSACGGGGLSGEYGSELNGQWETAMLFRNGTVEVDTLVGPTVAGTYEVRNDRVHITHSGATEVYPIDRDGCIDGGWVYGRLCKRP